MHKLIGDFAKYFTMSPVEVLEMKWFLFLSFTEYMADEIERKNKAEKKQNANNRKTNARNK